MLTTFCTNFPLRDDAEDTFNKILMMLKRNLIKQNIPKLKEVIFSD